MLSILREYCGYVWHIEFLEYASQNIYQSRIYSFFMRAYNFLKVPRFLILLVLSLLVSQQVEAQSKTRGKSKNQEIVQTTSDTDSIRVLIAKYDKCNSGIDGVVTISAVIEKDSSVSPLYIIGDNEHDFISELKVDAIKKIIFVPASKLDKKQKSKMPNGYVKVELIDSETYHTSTLLPVGKNLSRQIFVTRLSFKDLDNTNQSFSKLADEYVSSYGTDDQVFRASQDFAKGNTPILAIDSLDNKAFVDSFSDFKEGYIDNITAYDPENAVKLVGDRGFDGLFIVLIKSQYTLKESILPINERIKRLSAELDKLNMTSLVVRNPIIINKK